MKDNFDIFFRRKPALMLIALKKISRARYGSILAKEVDCTYSHAVKILQTLEKLGLVTFEGSQLGIKGVGNVYVVIGLLGRPQQYFLNPVKFITLP